MSGLAIGTAVAMLTVYATALFLALQQVADRFSPRFIPIVFRQRRVLVSLGVLLILLILAGTSAFLTTSTPITIATFVVLVITVVGALVASFQTLALVADGTRIVDWVDQTRDRDATLQDVLWKAIDRADHRVVVKALQVGLASDETEENLLTWLSRHRDLLSTGWLAHEGLTVLLAVTDTKPSSTASRFDVICTLLREALAAESFPLARDVTDETMDMLAEARPWTQNHAQLMYDLGFTIWNIGEHGVFSEPRTTKQASQLADTKDVYLAGTTWIRRHLLDIGDAQAVNAYGAELCTFGSDIQDKEARESVLARAFDLMADGFKLHLLTRRGVEVMMSHLGPMRYGFDEDNDSDYQEWIDSLVVTLAAIYIELPPIEQDDDIDDAVGEFIGDGQVVEIPVEVLIDGASDVVFRRPKTPQEIEDDAVYHLLGNGYIVRRHKRGDKIVCHKQDWLKPESYQRVARLLGVKDFAP